MRFTARARATYADLEALPSNLVGEILAGELHSSPRLASPHAYASSEIGFDLMGPFRRGRGGPGGWWILDEPELHLGEDVLVPDLAGWRRERMERVPDAPAFTQPPDWVCEVVSPSTSRIDRLLKMPIYAQHRVGHLWLVDPLSRTLEVNQLHEGHWLLLGVYGDDAVVKAPPFDAVPIELSSWWIGGGEGER